MELCITRAFIHLRLSIQFLLAVCSTFGYNKDRVSHSGESLFILGNDQNRNMVEFRAMHQLQSHFCYCHTLLQVKKYFISCEHNGPSTLCASLQSPYYLFNLRSGSLSTDAAVTQLRGQTAFTCVTDSRNALKQLHLHIDIIGRNPQCLYLLIH